MKKKSNYAMLREVYESIDLPWGRPRQAVLAK